MKIISILIVLLLCTSCDFTKAFSSSFAKEYCSCRFVVGQSKKLCKEYAENILPPWTIKENEEKKYVTVGNLFKSTTAVYTGKKYGCSIKD
ncbi:MAG: hypothetical protein KC493_11160 [Bacteriovoracaceae bacterium]|nr:hypothetical protein [Bacteriovoracaceae bacterium]